MFEYTKHVFNQTVEDIKSITNAVQLITGLIYIAYLIYAITVGIGIVAVNVVLLVISAIYFAFTLAMNSKQLNKSDRQLKENAKRVYKVSKYIIQIPTLVVAVITLSMLESDHITFSLLFTVLMILGYVMSVLLSVLTVVVENRAKKFMVAFEADVEPIMKVVNGIKKLKGDTVDPQPYDKAKEKIRSELDLIISKNRQQRKEKETAERILKKEERKGENREKIQKLKEIIKQKLSKDEHSKPEAVSQLNEASEPKSDVNDNTETLIK